MADVNVTGPSDEQVKLIGEVDPGSVARAASLSARGLDDIAIGEVLILSYEHVIAIKFTDEYKKAYAAQANRIIEEQFDRDEGWDTLENKSLEGILETLKYQKDPKFLLMAAQIANRAERRAKTRVNAPKVIDAPTGGGVTQNIIMFTLNRNYVQSKQNNTIEASERVEAKLIPLKQSDIPSPKLIDQLLSPSDKVIKAEKDAMKEDLALMFEQTGVVFDKS